MFDSSNNSISTGGCQFVLTAGQSKDATYQFNAGSMILYCGSTQTINFIVNSQSPGSVTSITWNIGMLDVPYHTGITYSEQSGTTIGSSLNKTIQITNENFVSGSSTLLAFDTRVYYNDGTSVAATGNGVSVDFYPPDYNFRLVIDTQPATSLTYNQSTTISFHVEDTNGQSIVANDLSWILACTESS